MPNAFLSARFHAMALDRATRGGLHTESNRCRLEADTTAGQMVADLAELKLGLRDGDLSQWDRVNGV